MASKSYEHIRQVQRRDQDGKAGTHPHIADPGARQSEFAVSRQGMNQESEHNKHNRPAKGAPKH
jgi:hypothetical protein